MSFAERRDITIKKYSKFLSFVVTSLMLLSIGIPVQAKENEKLFVDFSEFQFVANDYNPNEVHIEYETVGMNENAYIIDNNGTVLETMSVKSLGYRVEK